MAKVNTGFTSGGRVSRWTQTSNIAKLPVLTKEFWKHIGVLVSKKLVPADCAKGIMQDGTRNHPLSPQYRKYKANDMRRFSDGQRLGSPVKLSEKGSKTTRKGSSMNERLAMQFGKTKTVPKQRQFPLMGKSLMDQGKPYVTMRLTGDTVRGLHGVKPTKDGITMTFRPKDSVKILGNQQIGYNIVGLNKVNIELVRQELIKELRKNKAKYLNKDIKIGVGY